MNIDTPRTNDIIEQIKGFRTSSAIYSLEQFSRTLENELTSAQNKIQTLSEIGIDQMDKERSLKSELKTVTEQRDEWGNLWADLSRACVKDLTKVDREVVTLTEQRDRLAEALNKYRGQVDNEGNHSAPEALQSLTN